MSRGAVNARLALPSGGRGTAGRPRLTPSGRLGIMRRGGRAWRTFPGRLTPGALPPGMEWCGAGPGGV